MRFFLVDRVEAVEPGVSARGVKCVSLTDPILQDHFPGHPVWPGSLLIEGMAQLGGFLLEVGANREGDVRRALLTQVDRAKFRRPARPGDRLVVACTVASELDGAGRVTGIVTCDGDEVARAELTFVLRTIDAERVHRQRRELYAIWTEGLEDPPCIL